MEVHAQIDREVSQKPHGNSFNSKLEKNNNLNLFLVQNHDHDQAAEVILVQIVIRTLAVVQEALVVAAVHLLIQTNQEAIAVDQLILITRDTLENQAAVGVVLELIAADRQLVVREVQVPVAKAQARLRNKMEIYR